MKVVVVGGVAGGASAAARLRRMNDQAEIILFEKGPYISFANCGLPYYIGDVIRDKSKLVVTTPEMMKQRFNIDVRINSEVVAILTDTREVEVHDKIQNQTYRVGYDKLVLSPGAEPIKPPFPGVQADNIFTLRNIPDTYAIKDYVDQKAPRRAVIVGGGFIGLEVADNLHALGLQITIVELAAQVMTPLDIEMAALVHQHLKSKKVQLYLNDGVKAFHCENGETVVELQSGKRIQTDMVLLGIGVKPDTRLAKEAGLTIGVTGGIRVDHKLRTSNPDIYAIGDAIEIDDFINGQPALIPLAGPANKQGRIVANDIAGHEDRYKGTQGTSIVKVFDITVATTGNNEKSLQKYGIPYEKSFTHSASHAGYYPGAIPMAIKLLFHRETGKILGAQIIGYDGVDKRIDVIATAIRAGMTVLDLQELELAYAPPFSSAKDPVNMAGYVATNILNGDVQVIHWDEIASLDPNQSVLLDVRTPQENALGSIPNSFNIEVDDLRNRLGELPRDKEIVIYCQVGLRGYVAARMLLQNGFTHVRNLSGGYKTYAPMQEKQSNEDIFTNETSSSSDALFKNDLIGTNDEIQASGGLKEDRNSTASLSIDACGLQCPGPILKVFKAVETLNIGDILEIKATDPGFENDVRAWCSRTGHKFINAQKEKNYFTVYIRKGNVMTDAPKIGGNDKTMIIFSGDLDKALASFIIANGAVAMGRKVTMFFTFWGLNILRKPKSPRVAKDLLSRMFGLMMPKGANKLKLSKLNMAGMGTAMMKYVMKNKNVDSLEMLIEQAKLMGVKLVACTMSMDIMGLAPEELIDGIEMAGVASMLSASEESDATLFI